VYGLFLLNERQKYDGTWSCLSIALVPEARTVSLGLLTFIYLILWQKTEEPREHVVKRAQANFFRTR